MALQDVKARVEEYDAWRAEQVAVGTLTWAYHPESASTPPRASLIVDDTPSHNGTLALGQLSRDSAVEAPTQDSGCGVQPRDEANNGSSTPALPAAYPETQGRPVCRRGDPSGEEDREDRARIGRGDGAQKQAQDVVGSRGR